MQQSALIQQKFTPPKQHLKVCQRSDLMARMDAVGPLLLTQVVGPAGYGKTTFLSQYATYVAAQNSDAVVAWFSLESSDNEENQFFRLISAAMSHLDIVNWTRLQSSNNANSQMLDSFSQDILNALAKFSKPVIFIFDDFHHIRSRRILQFIEELLSIKASGLHLLMGSRVTPDLNIGHLIVSGTALQLEASDLRFSRAQVEELLGEIMNAQDLNAFYVRSEGWPVAVQLASIWYRQRKQTNYDDIVTGSSEVLNRYLEEQVFSSLCDDTQEVILGICFLERFSARQVDYMLKRDNSLEILEPLFTDYALLLPINDAQFSFRFHHLFASFLQKKALQKYGSHFISNMRIRASNWFVEQDELLEAVKQSRKAGYPQHAIDLVKQGGGWQIVMTQGIGVAESVVNQFSAEEISSSVTLSLLKSYLAIKFGELYTALEYFELARQLAGGVEQSDELHKDVHTIDVLLSTYRSEDMSLSRIEECQALIESLHESDHITHATLLAFVVISCNHLGDFKKAEHYARQAITQMQLGQCQVGVNYLLIHYGLSLLYRGFSDEANDIFIRSEGMSKQLFGLDTGLKYMSQAGRALVYYQQNELEKASTALGSCLPVLESMDCWVELYIVCYQAVIDIALLSNDVAQAREHIERGLKVARKRRFTVLRQYLNISAFKVAVLSNELPDSVLPWEGLLKQEDAIMHWSIRLTLSNALCLYFYKKHFLSKAYEYAESSCQKSNNIHAPFEFAYSQGLRCVCLHGQGRSDEASNAAIALFEQVHAQKLIQILLLLPDAFEGIISQLRNHCWEDCSTNVRKLIEAYKEQKSQRGTLQRHSEMVLSHRESQLAGLLCQGLSNKAIASHLGISENTVKFHLKKLFKKLNVGKRAQAIALLHDTDITTQQKTD